MQLHLHIDCCSWKANSFWRPDDTQYFCADIRLGIVSINNSFLLYGNEGETCEAAAQCEFEEEERGKWEWQAEREVVNSARQYPILRKIERTTHSKQDGIQSNTLNGSALGLTKIWTNKRIGPLTNILYKESIKMELTKTNWTIKLIGLYHLFNFIPRTAIHLWETPNARCHGDAAPTIESSPDNCMIGLSRPKEQAYVSCAELAKNVVFRKVHN